MGYAAVVTTGFQNDIKSELSASSAFLGVQHLSVADYSSVEAGVAGQTSTSCRILTICWLDRAGLAETSLYDVNASAATGLLLLAYYYACFLCPQEV